MKCGGGENENGGFSAEPVNFDLAECKDLIHNLEKFSFELSAITNNKGSKDFYWNNPAIGACDASIYYSMIRYFKPKHCIEIGSGYSTLLAARAAKLNNTTEFEAIEPYPFEWLEQIENLSRLTKSKIQDVPLEYFDKLEENDILFVDNSHVCKVGSDVNHIILRILPRLKAGVIIHFHDIFLPFEIAKSWVKEKALFWNEQYLLQALLIGGDSYKTILPVHYLSRYDSSILEAVTGCKPEVFGGGSYWIKKIHA